MPTVNLTGATWRKSSYSVGSGSNGDCVEVAHTGPTVAIRHSKSPSSGALAFSVSAWRAFTTRSV